MADANDKDETPKSNTSPEKDVDQLDVAPSNILSNKEEEEEPEEEESEDDEEYDEEEDEYSEEEEDEYEETEEEAEEEKVKDVEGAVAIANNEGVNINKEHEKGEAISKEETNKESVAEKDEKKAVEPKNGEELGETSKRKEKPPTRPKSKSKVKNKAAEKAVDGDKPESSTKKNGSKRVESMGMVFMCTSKTKTDCFRYKILGLPANKKDQVAKIYKGMRLFLFDVDLRLMYGIFKAAGPGGYNLEPKAFKSDFPSQVRFTVLDDCLPVAEENFRDVIKENYYTRNKFEGLLKAHQVKKLCKLFAVTSKGPKTSLKPRRTEPLETRRTRPDDTRRSRLLPDDRDRKKRKRRPREEERRPRPRPRSRSREKRRYTDYERPPIVYERELPIPRYLPPPGAMSPVRSYAYERPLDSIHPYEHRTYRVVDVEPRHHERERDRDPYYVFSREPPPPTYRDAVYHTLPPEYHLVSREYNPLQPPEYRLPPRYHPRDVEIPTEYRSSASALPEYRSQRTHYRY